MTKHIFAPCTDGVSPFRPDEVEAAGLGDDVVGVAATKDGPCHVLGSAATGRIVTSGF